MRLLLTVFFIGTIASLLKGADAQALPKSALPVLREELQKLLVSEGYKSDTTEFSQELDKALGSCQIDAAIDLDGDGTPELIVWVGWHSGNHHNSIDMPVLKQLPNGVWKCLGHLFGSSAQALKTKHGGFFDITTWHGLGGRDGLEATFCFLKGSYTKIAKREIKLTGESEQK